MYYCRNNKLIYPIVFSRKIKFTIWGGYRFYQNEGSFHDFSMTKLKIGELWNFCDSVVALNGMYQLMNLEEIICRLPCDYFGDNDIKKNYKKIPIVLKIIDANDDLSIQVHPDKNKAKELENYFQGKTEVWFVLDSKQNSEIIYGFNKNITKDEILFHLNNNTLDKILNKVKVQKDDIFLINPGTVHAIGKGILIAEIQENCDITYRIYDYNRIDINGQKRELHINKALECIKLSNTNNNLILNNLTSSDKNIYFQKIDVQNCFTIIKYNVKNNLPIKISDNFSFFSVFMNIGEDLLIKYGKNFNDSYIVNKYSSFLMPANYKAILMPKCSNHSVSLLQVIPTYGIKQKKLKKSILIALKSIRIL